LRKAEEKLEKRTVLEVKGLIKYFGGVKAVDNVDLQLYENEIIAIVGDNGAGKSTLIKAISGAYKRDSGEIKIDGEVAHIFDTKSARRYGIETVYQDQGLILDFDAASNVFLGREKYMENSLGNFIKLLNFKYMKKEAEKLYKKIGINFKNINTPVRVLSGGQRQGIVIGKAIYWGGKIIIFDEPTNNLGVKEQKRVIDLIKQLRDKYNIAIIIISHNLFHVFELVDRIIVLKNGRKIAERVKNDTTQHEIVSLITGANT